MKWPAPSDYQDAIQNPRACFLDEDLQGGVVSTTPLGLPRVASGNFASVYEVKGCTKRWAVRCFLRQVSDQGRRYSLLSQHLSGLWLPSLVKFEYLPQGIRVHGKWYPIVKMEWVDGETLHTFVEKRLGDGKALLELAAKWRGLVNSLRGNHLAHGDLQHGNVLVAADGGMKLVDYDAMFVPRLGSEKSPELGHVNYQHPKREVKDYNEDLDNFSALVVYLSLRALAWEPDLWARFHNGDNLVLSADDYKTPLDSALLKRLEESEDESVKTLAAELKRSCLGSMKQVPELEVVVDALTSPQQSGGTGRKAVKSPSSGPWWQGHAPAKATVTSSARPKGRWWMWGTLALSLLSLTPALFLGLISDGMPFLLFLRQLLGLGAVVCGIIAWRRTRTARVDDAWMERVALGAGGVALLLALIPLAVLWFQNK